MVDLNINISGYEKNIKKTDNVEATTQSAQPSSVEIPIGKNETGSQKTAWEKLNITQEEYTKLCNQNPQFVNLPLEEQVKYITSLNNKAQTTAAEGTSANTVSSTGASDVETADQTATAANELSAQESDAIKQAANEEFLQSTDKDLFGVDRTAFKNATPEEKVEIFKEEFTKNKFLYSSEPPKTEEEWNALSDEEKQKLIKATNKEIEKFSGLDKILDSAGKVEIVEKMYTYLQVANQDGLSLTNFLKKPLAEQDEAIYSYLDAINQMDRSATLTQFEENYYLDKKELAEAANYYFEQKTGEKYNFCPGDVSQALKQENTNLIEVKQLYFEHKLEEYENMSDAEKAALPENEKKAYERMKVQLPALNKFAESPVGAVYMEQGMVQKPEEPSVLDKLQNSQAAESGVCFANADDKSKAFIVNLAITKNSKTKDEYAEEMDKCIQSALADGNVNLAFELFEVRRKVLPAAETNNDATNVVAVVNSDKLTSKEAVQLAKKNEQIEHPDLRKAAAQTIQQNATEEQAEDLAGVYIDSKDEETRIGVVDNLRNREEFSPKIQEEVDIIVKEKGDIPVRAHAIETIGKMHDSVQIPSLERQLSDAVPELVQVATKVPSTLDDQVGAGEIVFNATLKLNDDDRVKAQKSLADNIIDFKEENQLAMHKIMLQSTDDEVLAHTSSNINKYHDSVQADAIKASYDTGNQKAIDAVNAQLDKCDAKAVEAVGSDIIARETEATESRYSQEVAQQVAEFNQKYQELTGNTAQDSILPNADEQKIAFVQDFLSATPQEQYKLLSKIPQAWQGTVFSKICQYCPNLLSGLVKQGYGKQILKTPGMPSDVIYKVINTMLTCGASDKKDASKYVVDHKYLFTESTLERCEEILASSKGREQKYSSAPIGGGVQAVLQPGMSAIYPDKKDMFYKA